jgi:hypothetical protein
MDLSKYQVELAKSNRAQCRETSCKQNIGKGELRIGLQGADYYSWYHAPCAFKTFTNRYIRNREIKSVDDIQYFDQLSEEHQTVIRQLIDGTYLAPPETRHNPRPKRGAPTTSSAAVEDTKSSDSAVVETTGETIKRSAKRTKKQ